MQKLKKIIFAILSLIIIAGTFNVSTMAYTPSSWAQEYVDNASLYGLIPEIINDKPYNENITRQEFCHLVIKFYCINTSTENKPEKTDYFTDTDDSSISLAYELGIVNGRGDNIFSPNDLITRQEMALMIEKTLAKCGVDTGVTANDIVKYLGQYNDLDTLANWATNAFAFNVKASIITGLEETILSPTTHATREQAITVIYRCFEKYTSDEIKENALTENNGPQISYDSFDVSSDGYATVVSYNDRCINLSWDPFSNAASYSTDIYLSAENFWYTPESTYVKTLNTDTNTVSIKNIRTAKHYTINIYAINEAGEKTDVRSSSLYVSPIMTLDEKTEYIFADGEITTKEEADANMTQISVPVWRINKNGQKYESTAYIDVHIKIADITTKVFEEIFNGEEKFPIYDVGGYTWRAPMGSGRYSHHNYGTAIDINSAQNYCLYSDGSFSGSFWLPGVDEYSISPDSEVVSIFAKYGFIWGGDEWSNPKDYMHFSYLEL